MQRTREDLAVFTSVPQVFSPKEATPRPQEPWPEKLAVRLPLSYSDSSSQRNTRTRARQPSLAAPGPGTRRHRHTHSLLRLSSPVKAPLVSSIVPEISLWPRSLGKTDRQLTTSHSAPSSQEMEDSLDTQGREARQPSHVVSLAFPASRRPDAC